MLGGYQTISIGDNTFRFTSGIVHVTIPDGVTTIGYRGCACLDISSFIIPNSVVSIGDQAFINNLHLTEVIIGSNVTSIGNEAFLNVDWGTSLTSITFMGLTAPVSVGTNWLYKAPSTLRGHAYAASNFPAPGYSFYDLTMGSYLITTTGAPTGLTAIGENAQVLLNWTAPAFNGGSNISFYNVYRSTSETGTYSHINSSTDTFYLDTNLTNGQSYWYKISAVNDAGEGEKTKEISSIPFTVPDAPTTLNIITGNAQVSLNWTAPAFNGGKNIDYYQIYQDDEILLEHYVELSATISNLTNGHNYSFAIVAHNLAGEGLRSITSYAIPYTIPNAPTGLTSTPGNSQVMLYWAAPSFDGGGNIDYYTIYQDNVDIKHVTGNSIIITDLINGVSYNYKISAHNNAGNGINSSSIVSTPTPVSDAPNNFSIIDGANQAILTWNTPLYPNWTSIDYYIIYQDGIDIKHVSNESVIIVGLTNSQPYVFAVAAHNLAGIGTLSIPKTAIPFTFPDAPNGFTATPGNSQVTLYWNTPSFDGGRDIDYYVIYQDGVVVKHVTGNSIMITGLSNGRLYSFIVSAHNLAGDSNQSITILATPHVVPNTPAGITAIADNGQVMLNWTEPINNGGAIIDYYIVYQDGVDVKHIANNSTTITGLTNGRSYSFAVSAHNLAGNSTQTGLIYSIPFTTPDAPTGLVAVAGNANISLNWAAPAFDGGRAIDYYVIYQDGIDVQHVSGVSTIITGLTNGQTYSFNVTAHNPARESNQFGMVLATPFTVPDVPTGLTALPSNAQIVLNWTAPEFDGGSDIDYYIVYQDGVDVKHVTGISTSITELTNGQEYSFTVAAHNLANTGLQSIAVISTPCTIPEAPSGLLAIAGNGQVLLEWTTPTNNGGNNITGYSIYRGTLSGSLILIATAISTNYTDDNITNGQEYYYTVSAVNSAGEGVPAVEVIVTPNAPENTNNTSVLIIVVSFIIILILIIVYILIKRKGEK